MKAIRVHEFGSAEVMRLEEIAAPVPGPRELLIEIRAAGVNPVDTYIRSGTYARKKPSLPYTPGADGAGVVEAVGSEVVKFKPGDRVYVSGSATGTYAAKAVCSEQHVYRLPDRLTFPQGAGVWVPYATAHHALFHAAGAQPGEAILIHGASGGVGSAAIQMARALGLRVIGTAGTESGLKLVRELGAAAVNHHDKDAAEQIHAVAGKGPDIILEMLANVNLSKDLGMIAPRGRIVVIGNRGTVEINPRDAMSKDVSIRGMLLLNITPEETARIEAALAAGLENGILSPIAGKEFPLAEAPQAHAAVLAPGAYGKITLIP